MSDQNGNAPDVNPACHSCDDPATHLFLDTMETVCERCARERAAHARGEAFAALQMLETVVRALREAGLTRDEIAAATREAADVADAFPGDASELNGPLWQMGGFQFDTRFIPITEGSA